MRILGFTLGHDSSVALVEGGKVLGIMEAERYFRQKRYKLHAISLDPTPMASGYQMVKLEDLLITLEWVKREWGNHFDGIAVQNQGRIDEFENIVNLLRREGFEFTDTLHVDHHLSHASLAFYTSPFSESLILSYDGTGNDGYTIFFKADGKNGISYIERNETRFGQSYNNLGYMTKVGPDVAGSTAGKTMGLTSYGEVRKEWLPYASQYVKNYRKLPAWPVDGLADKGKGHKVNSVGLNKIPELQAYIETTDYQPGDQVFRQLKQFFSREDAIRELHLPGPEDKTTQDLLKTVQTAWTSEVMNLLGHYRHVSSNLCVVGGCALNGITNYEIEKSGWFRGIHLVPNPSDCGLSAGAALYMYYMKSKQPFAGYREYFSPYQGIEAFDRKDLPSLKKKFPHRDLEPGQVVGTLASLLHKDKIVGVVRGRYEAGPRALGNRSIFCNPLNPQMRDILNDKVKHREWYRPFAPIVTAEDSKTYFTNDNEIPYMSVICYTRPQYVETLPAITHVDHSARVQTIRKDQNEFVHSLVKQFETRAGMPILLNTSFNPGGEPILNFYEVALDMLKTTGLDLVLIEDTLFAKPGMQQALGQID